MKWQRHRWLTEWPWLLNQICCVFLVCGWYRFFFSHGLGLVQVVWPTIFKEKNLLGKIGYKDSNSIKNNEIRVLHRCQSQVTQGFIFFLTTSHRVVVRFPWHLKWPQCAATENSIRYRHAVASSIRHQFPS